jgi:hypothetical protein
MFGMHLLLVASLIAGSPRETVTRASIAREISSFVRIHTVDGPDGRPARLVAFAVDSVPSRLLLASFLKRHGRIVGYLAAHTQGASARLVSEQDNPLAVRDSVIAALRDSREFNDRLYYMLAAYWRPSGRAIEGYVPIKRASLPPATLRRVGARFFYPDRFSESGDTMFTHVCAGINGIGDLPELVDPLVEAFVFVAVNSAFFAPKSRLMQSYERAAIGAKTASVSVDPAKRLLRAQGAMWAQMEQSPAMSAAMRTAFRKYGPVMPFRIDSAVP